jgi:hypothetical protein
MSKFWAFASLIVGGIIVADLITHGQQTGTVVSSLSGAESNVGSQLLGTSTSKAG